MQTQKRITEQRALTSGSIETVSGDGEKEVRRSLRGQTAISVFTTRKRILISLAVVVPAGFFFKLYSGPAQTWLNNYGAGVLYELFWCLVIFLFWPRGEIITRIVASVFAVTCFLEVLQLWHPWLLEEIRSTFLGSALLGTTFSWWDFPHYIVGCTIGWFWMHGLLKTSVA